ncbi:MAG: hypothetical protein ACOH5I_22105 [Oligoflexus sp.]
MASIDPGHSLASSQKSDLERALGKAFWGMVKLYGLNREEQAYLLEMSPSNRVPLKKLEEMQRLPKGEFPQLLTKQLLGIHKNLGILYPRSDEIADNQQLKRNWFKRPMLELDGKKPIDWILEGDARLVKLAALRRTLDIIRTSH